MRHRIQLSALITIGMLVLTASLATAQTETRFDIQQFNPMPAQRWNYLGQASGSVMPHGVFEIGLLADYADDPLVLESVSEGTRLGSLVSEQLTARLLFGIGLFDRLELGLDLPIILLQSGGDVSDLPDATIQGEAGIGDIRFVPSIMFVAPSGDDVSGVSLGLTADLFIPTGNPDEYQGEGLRAHPRLAFDFTFPNTSRIGLNVGYMVRPEATLANLQVDDVFTASAAADIQIVEAFRVVPELQSEFSILADALDTEERPMEGLLALRFFPVVPFMIEAGGGMGFNSGFGTPDWRVFLGLSYSNVPDDRDTDGDGYLDSVDGCPLDPEDFDDFEDEDGCPDPDNDSDTILDVDDTCPMDPEDFDQFEDEDGCPDPDNDRDTILDVVDLCPMDPEDFDQFEDEDGCPDIDNDRDGILDVVDECPLVPETLNGHEDEDGCPDEGLIEVVPCVALELGEKVYFDTDSDVIQERSYTLLNQLTQALLSNPSILRVRIAGHTDSRGSDEYNLALSDRRAASVMNHLIEAGIDPSRLESAGYGETQPIETNDTSEGRQANRRVEAAILEQEGCD